MMRFKPPRPMESLLDSISRAAHPIWRGAGPTAHGRLIPVGLPGVGFRDRGRLAGRWPGGGSDLGGWPKLSQPPTTRAGYSDAGWQGHLLAAREVEPSPPTFRPAGIEVTRVLINSSKDHHRRLWAAEQCLRSGACGALTDPMLRRLKLASSASDPIMFLLRSDSVAVQPSPASVRIRLRSATFALKHREITILKGAHPPRSLVLDLDARG